MTVMTPGGIYRAPRPSTLADVLDIVLDKGIVIDAFVRVSLVGIELLTLDARIVIASVDTYLRFAEAVHRLDLQPRGQVTGLPGLMQRITEGGAKHKTKGAIDGVKEKLQEAKAKVTGGDDEGEEEERRPRRTAGRTSSRAGGDRDRERPARSTARSRSRSRDDEE